MYAIVNDNIKLNTTYTRIVKKLLIKHLEINKQKYLITRITH